MDSKRFHDALSLLGATVSQVRKGSCFRKHAKEDLKSHSMARRREKVYDQYKVCKVICVSVNLYCRIDVYTSIRQYEHITISIYRYIGKGK